MIRSSGLDSFIGKRWSMMISELKPLELSSVLDVGMTGDGRRIPANMTFPVVNPATEEEYARVPAIDREQLDFVMESAAEAFRTWSQDDVSRCKIMHAAADLLEEHIAEIATLLTAEQGKPFRESVSEVATGCVWLRWYADLDVVQPKIVQDDDQARIAIYRRPLGPSVLITAWNFPVQMALKKIAQALRPGNTVVVKPASGHSAGDSTFGRVTSRGIPSRCRQCRDWPLWPRRLADAAPANAQDQLHWIDGGR
jgi:acyl-CoA reductase-like NAD-dependent aldehyde dehydrogenase